MVRDFAIKLRSLTTPPAQLQELLDTVLTTPRASEKVSPAAKRIGQRQPTAERANEAKASYLLVGDILFSNEAWGGEKYVTLDHQVPLDLAYRPKPPDAATRALYPKGMPQPIPDALVGYIMQEEAGYQKVEAPFSEDEETALDKLVKPRLTGSCLFPFLSAEFKRSRGSESRDHALLQVARGSTTIINHLRLVLTRAGIAPTPRNTCHWSVTSDMSIIQLWLVWADHHPENGTLQYHIQQVARKDLCDLEDEENPGMVEFRRILRNILSWAMGERLDTIRKAMVKLVAIAEGKDNVSKALNAKVIPESSGPPATKKQKRAADDI
ncbi:hypothetical protein IQ07DRAFT_502074 [Pyrenochaeta sp. DS3sAY3a]|nr:hypothetical protein IQ07DRAFT_502074 [Pyrenochaeta sp. DS3sAY3a]